MSKFPGLDRPHQPDWRGLVDNVLRKGTPRRVYHMELGQDLEVHEALVRRFDLCRGVPEASPDYMRRARIALARFCGWDYVAVGLKGQDLQFHRRSIPDTAELKRKGGRSYQDEHTGPIMSWQDFEKYPWPDPHGAAATEELEWYERNLPEDMCIIGGFSGHFAEGITWLMGYETLCYTLHDDPALVEAIAKRLLELYRGCMRRLLQFERVKMIWSSDDMGFKTGTLISPADTRKYVLSGHQVLAEMAHAAGRPYLLHACGNLTDILENLIEDVEIDAKHSFEDTIEDVRQVKHTYGRRIALLGGVDVDFLCRSDEAAVRRRVRETLDVCLPGGGYCLGTGNTVANYIPLDNYLAMVDEGRLYGR